MKTYKDYLLVKAHTEHYDLFLICLNHESFLSYLEEIESEEEIRGNSGEILVDQLTVTGNGKNRFLLCPFKDGKLDLSSARVVTPADTYKEYSSKHFRSRIEQLENSILSDEQFERIKNGKTI